MTRPTLLPRAAAAAAVALLASCSPPGPIDPVSNPTAASTQTATTTPSAAPTTPAPTPTPAVSVTESPTPASTASGATDLLLAQQIGATGVPNIRPLRCPEEEPAALPAAFFVSFTPEAGELELGQRVALCLAGFDPVLPLRLTVSLAATDVATATVALAPEAEELPTALDDRQTLFDGEGLTASARPGSPYYQSPAWDLVPSEEMRDVLAVAGEMSIDLRQGDLAFSFVQAVAAPSEPGHRLLSDEGPFIVWGFEPDLRVPIGLYERGEDFDSPYTLVEQVGMVTMPLSRLAIFDVPTEVVELLREPGLRYRLWAPRSAS